MRCCFLGTSQEEGKSEHWLGCKGVFGDHAKIFCFHIGVLLFSSGRSRKKYQYSTEGQKRHQNLATALVIIWGKSLVFSRKTITSTGFLPVLRLDASAPVVVKKTWLPRGPSFFFQNDSPTKGPIHIYKPPAGA